MHIHTYIYICMYTHTNIYIYIYTHIYMHKHNANIRIYIRTPTHIHNTNITLKHTQITHTRAHNLPPTVQRYGNTNKQFQQARPLILHTCWDIPPISKHQGASYSSEIFYVFFFPSILAQCWLKVTENIMTSNIMTSCDRTPSVVASTGSTDQVLANSILRDIITHCSNAT